MATAATPASWGGEPEENTYDFHDVLVLPRYQGRGMHTRFLNLFEEMARAMGGRAIYATVDPGNSASWHNFEKGGLRAGLHPSRL